MSEITLPPNTRIVFSVKTVSSIRNSIYPRLRIDTEFTRFSENQDDALVLTNIVGNLSVVSKDGPNMYYFADMTADYPFVHIPRNGSTSIPFFVNFDHYGLSRIERLRGNTDLTLRCSLRFVYKFKSSNQDGMHSVQDDYTIRKSEWVEKLLNELNYKTAFLLEIPLITGPEYVEVAKQLDDAWRKLAMGEYADVMGSCQKALEKVKNIAIAKGMEKDKDIDFGEIFTDSSQASDAIDSIWRKLSSFFQPGGRHSGRNINKEDAEFAMLVTWGLINLLVKNI